MGVIVVNPYSTQGFQNLYSAKLDGVDEEITIADSDAFSFGAAGATENPFSLSLWYKPTSVTTIQGLMLKGDTGQYEYTLLHWNDNRLYFELFSELNSGIWAGRGTNTSLLTNNTWAHIVVTYSGSKTLAGIKIYKDGVRVDSTNDTAGTYVKMNNGTGLLYLGAQGPFHSSGYINHPAVFSKELSGTEVSELYAAGKGDYRLLSFGGTCVSAWKFNNGTLDYPTFTDYINGRNGTMINMESADINTDVPT